MTRQLTALFAIVLATGCQQATKAPVHDTFSKLSDGKADGANISSIAYGKTSSAIKVRSNSYGWLQFSGNIGDDVEIWARSKDGDAVAFLLDANDDVVAMNDDCGDGSSDAHITATLPADGTYYIGFRDYSYGAATFTVQLSGSGVFTCAQDSDCVAVKQAGCCDNGYLAAVNKDRQADYPVLYACQESAPICSHIYVQDKRVAQCDFTAGKCQMIDPSQIRCGGFFHPTHGCPDGWQCHFQGVPDVPGTCVQSAQ